MDTFFHVLVQNSADAVVILDAGGGILFASESATPSAVTRLTSAPAAAASR